MKKLLFTSPKDALTKEALRRRYRPVKVKLLFVGEAPPASGRFFYRADSGLYRAIRSTFIQEFPSLENADFLQSFRDLGCYLVDLCGKPVDHLDAAERRQACLHGEIRLAKMIRQFQPTIIVILVRSIVAYVERSQRQANWQGTHLKLPYPGRWQHHRVEFEKALVPVLRKELANHGADFLRKRAATSSRYSSDQSGFELSAPARGD
jgi:hypothetical protein